MCDVCVLNSARQCENFQPFSERIASIDVDVFHRVGHLNETDEEDSVTHFQKTLQKCNDLNLAKSYEALKKKIGYDVQTLPQLLAQKERIVSVLSESLEQADSFSLQPCLELIVALAQDLRQEFYPFYSNLLTKILNLLNTKDTDQLEWTFTCLAYLFKYLWRFLVRDLNIVFEQLLPLLSSSRPQCINNFAAESFAYVARKVKDKRNFLKLVLKSVIKSNDGVPGCGKLLFEVVKGVQGQFHNCAQSWLQFLLQSLEDDGLPSQVLVDILSEMFTCIATGILTKYSKMFWDSLQENIKRQVLKLSEEISEKCLNTLKNLLQLTLVVLNYKNCVFLLNPAEFVKTVTLIISDNCPLDIMMKLVDVSRNVLLSPRISLPQDVSVALIQKIISSGNWEAVVSFTSGMLPYSGFDSLILPSFLKHCQDQNFDQVLLELTRIVLNKTPPSKSFSELKNTRHYPLPCSLKWREAITQELLNILKCVNQADIDTNLEKLIQAVTVLPNMARDSPTMSKEVINLASKLTNKLVDSLKSTSSPSKILFLMHQTLSAIFLLSNKGAVDLELGNVHEVLLPMINTSVLALQTLEIYVNIVKLGVYEKDRDKMKCQLTENLTSPFHQIRSLSASLLLFLEPSNESEVHKILSTIVKAEDIGATIHEYRDKLRQLQMLECSDDTTRQTEFRIPVNYLLGNLHINFKLLWEPVSKLIVSYAKLIPSAEFWPVFLNQLNLAVAQVQNGVSTLDKHDYECEVLAEASKQLASVEERPDVFNRRILLWQLMTNFPEVCEEKNRDIVVLFLDFLKTEYFRLSPEDATCWNIKQGKRKTNDDVDKKSTKEEDSMEVENINGDLNEIQDSDDDDEEEEVKNETITPGRTASKSLLAHLTVFSKLRNPRSMFKEPELYKTYLDFLSHKNPDVQKAALDCIMTYKFKYLTPYKEHLYGLIDDKTFKEEVTLFRIDADNEIIRPEHRADLIPVVMRIVYSKMLNRSGARTGSKSAKQVRRSIVFRFLAGCKHEELLFYLKMAFRLYASTVQDDAAAMVQSVQSTLDLSAMVPPKRLLSTVNLLMVVLSQCGSLLSEEALRFLLRVLLCVGVTVSSALSQREVVHAGYFNILKNIRTAAFGVIIKFFSAFETFPWTSQELDVVYNVFVWPYLPKLPVEGIHSPTPLMKLFMAWSQLPRYFPLLIKYQKDSPEVTPLPFIMTLLTSTKTHGSVVNAIMDIVDKLVNWEDNMDEDVPPTPPLLINDLLDVDSYDIQGHTNFGSRILYPHIPAVLERMKRKLSRPKATLGHRDLTILSHVTSLVHDSETSETLLSLMIPVVGRKAGAGEHVICPLITTVTNLITNVTHPRGYIRSLAPLFGSVVGAEPRRMLSALVKSIDGEENGLNAQLLADLNAWNAKWLDQPDFERRLDAFKIISQLNSDGKITIEQGVIIIYTCFHFIRTEKDMSLKDCASQCLHKLCPSLCQQYPGELEFLVNKTILGILAAGLRDKRSETVQQESITLLGYMARECPQVHPVLRDLSLLGNKIDMEVDFFENLQHLQLHRKVRALLKFCDVCKTLSKPLNTRTLTQFVLPIISNFLCSEKYQNKNTIVDAAIEVLGTVCKMLPWHQYELVLRFYLGKLKSSVEYQKQLVRIIVIILNAFHFDLSNADLKETPVIENIVKDSKPTTDENSEENKENEENKEEEDSQEDKPKEDDLEELLDKDESMMTQDDTEVMEVQEEVVPVIERQIVLNKSLATRVIYTIRTILLPQLHRTITARTQSDAMHKVNRKMAGPDRDEEDILRVPIGLAMVKLLQRLPEEVLQQNICGILMKLCTFLKSRLDSVRRITRETLQKVIVTLGPKYLLQLAQEMSTILTHGFHVHVMVYSLHSVLVAVKGLLQPGDIDPCVPIILQACRTDLFGKTAEEKEVKQIAGNLMEARANRSYDMYHILAEFVSQKSLINLIVPLKEEVSRTLSHKSVNKARECLRHIVLGLVDNKFVTTESLLIFAYGTSSESVPALFSNLKKDQKADKPKTNLLEERKDVFLIPSEPKSRPSAQTKHCVHTNAHIFVEFGLLLYYFLLKREKIKGADYRPHLDPLVKVLSDCLKSEHVKITSISLQCLCWVVKFDLPTLKTKLEDITDSVFKLLHKYAAAGLSKGDNFDLVMAAFKVVAVIVRDVKHHQLSPQQQRTLLLYCEQDIHDYSRQTIAFSLLKAILGRKLRLPELNSVMEKVAKISITADIEHIRLQARQVFHQYLMEYALGKKFEKHLTWYLQQLEYELQPGRESALEMIKTLIITLPADILKEQSGFIFVTVAARLVNDDVPVCRKMAADIVTLLLEKVNNNVRESLFDIVLLWMQDKKLLHRRLAVQLCGLFASQEKSGFDQRIDKVLPLIVELMKVEIKEFKPHAKTDVEKFNIKEQLKDHHLYQLLHLIVKLSSLCPSMLTDQTNMKNTQILAEGAQTLLAYPHEWVRLAASQFIGKVLSVMTPTQVAELANSPQQERGFGYLRCDTRNTLKSLILDLCSQFTPGIELNEKLLMQTMKNLIFLAEVVQHVHNDNAAQPLTLQWLVRRIRKVIHSEVVHAPNFTILRTMCYNWLAALVVKLASDAWKPHLPLIMSPIVRELHIPDEEDKKSLKEAAKETANIVKKKVGSEEYNRLLNSLTTKLQIQKAERKKERAQLAVREPEKAAKRKISKQLKKKEQKKRKIEGAKKGKLKRKPKLKTNGFDSP
ncbi:small subunit processome component 20 homolog [Macrosteles quadrilineatus]|uniref:small subunit processome component 20 homolog n=1 Tax=Macrosteles quadrilineatus TaxID=74068 RepID=UPI0023E307C7|nr:small subunit processome component 20 homolog [Macrosteles quadrilineatus]